MTGDASIAGIVASRRRHVASRRRHGHTSMPHPMLPQTWSAARMSPQRVPSVTGPLAWMEQVVRDNLALQEPGAGPVAIITGDSGVGVVV
jgi:hypothetical protein